VLDRHRLRRAEEALAVGALEAEALVEAIPSATVGDSQMLSTTFITSVASAITDW
jgi:hypothetical protein